MIRSMMLLISSLLCIPLWAQHPLDNCNQALPIELSLPSTCPESSIVTDTFTFDLTEASASPYLSSSLCSNGQPSSSTGDIWISFLPKGNELTFSLSGTERPQLILMRGSECNNLIPIDCASGDQEASLQAGVSINEPYHLLIAGGSGDVQLIISSTNNCSPCSWVRDGFFSASPAPVNGRYPGGQEVQMCFTVDQWSSTPNSELLHALELSFGEGWDMSTFVPLPPVSCSDNGTWGWYNGWISEATGEAFGPGFAFDEIKNGLQDGNPGNNRGLDGIGCSDIGGFENDNTLQFCWTITTESCPPNEFGYPALLNIEGKLLGDGLSGSWWQTACYNPVAEHFQSSLYCPDLFEPEITIIDATCGSDCDGALALAGAGAGPWDYVLSDTSGNLIYLATSIPGPDTIPGLCPGWYEILIVDNASNEARQQLVEISGGVIPMASATFELPCFEGEPIQLNAVVEPSGGTITYLWTGPNGFLRTTPDPMALFPGAYTLEVSVNGCPAPPYAFTIPSVNDIEIVQLGPDTITICEGDVITLTSSGIAENLTWTLVGGDAILSTADSLVITPANGSIYQAEGTSANGCTGTDFVFFQVALSPTLTVWPNTTLCPGESTTLSVDQGTTWAWNTGDTTNQITVTPTGNTTYSVTVSDDNACSTILSANISVASGNGFFVFQDQELCAGESAMLGASGGIGFVWSTGATTPGITVTPDTTTTYFVTQTDQFGCTFTDSVTVTVNNAPQLSYVPEEVLICAGDEVTLQLFQADTLFWDTLVSPVSDAEYYPPFDFGCQSIDAFHVYVSPLPGVSITGPDTLCGLDSVLLVGEGIGLLQWNDGTLGDSLMVAPDDQTTYFLTANDTITGCSAMDSLTITPISAPAAPDIMCESRLGAVRFSWPLEAGLSYTVTVIDGPEGFFQSDNQYSIVGLSPGETASIILEVSQGSGCTTNVTSSCTAPDCDILDLFTLVPESVCIDDGSVALLADVAGGTNQGEGFWSGPGLDSTGLIFDPVLAGAGMHSMIYQYTDQGCMISDTAYIEVAGILAADQVSCSSSGDTLSFSWPQQLNDTAYVVNVLNGPDGFMDGNSYHIPGLSFGDSASVSITVQSDGPCGAYEVFAECALTTPDCPSINLPADTFICNGASVVLDFIDTLAWTNYEWAPEVSISCTDCAHPTVSPEINTTYQVIVSNSNGCTDTVGYTVYVQVFPTSYIPDEPIKFCPGESFELCMPDGDLHYWIGPNAFISTDQCLFFSELTAANEGNYYAFMRANGCRFLKAFKLEAAPELQVEVTPDFQTICPNDTFSLSATAPNAVDFNWSPANYLDCPECPVTTGAIPQTGTFILTVTDSFGCTATDQAVVFVDDCVPAPRPSQQADTNRLAVFPNPASDRMELITGLTGVKTIEIWSITGQFRGSAQFEGQHHLVTVDHLSPGPYIIRVSNTEQSELVRLIINR